MLKVLSQKQAHKRYPKRGYDKYDPMLLVVGTRKDFAKGVKTQLLVNGKLVQEPQAISDGSWIDEPLGTSVDFDDRKETRLVIWVGAE